MTLLDDRSVEASIILDPLGVAVWFSMKKMASTWDGFRLDNYRELLLASKVDIRPGARPPKKELVPEAAHRFSRRGRALLRE